LVIIGGSFRLPAGPIVALAGIWRRAAFVLIVPLLAASCGGSSTKNSRVAAHVVRGPGFQFSVPEGWTVHRSVRTLEARREAALVSATAFTLIKPYAPELFAQAVKELDGVAAKLAAESNGTLTASATTTVDGTRIRAYRFTGRPAKGAPYDERIGFLLQGKREVELLCQATAGSGDPDGACALLFSSFRLEAE